MTSSRPLGWMVSPYSDDGSGCASSALWKAFDAPRLACSSAIVGGGLVELNWVLNATVAVGYRHPDPAQHARSVAEELQLAGDGACLLTAVDVSVNARWGSEESVMVMATAGISQMGWASMPRDAASDADAPRPGTINIVLELPVPMSHGALVNMVMTATEAKAQYLTETGRRGTGTPTDAIVVVCPRGAVTDDGQYGGPRSRWGSVAARAVVAALHAGDRDIDR